MWLGLCALLSGKRPGWPQGIAFCRARCRFGRLVLLSPVPLAEDDPSASCVVLYEFGEPSSWIGLLWSMMKIVNILITPLKLLTKLGGCTTRIGSPRESNQH